MERIIKGKECQRLLLEGINELADAVTLTLGPNGSTVIITDLNGNPYITKDGVSVAKSIFFDDTVKNIAANLIKEVANKTVSLAGDGTTTSICLAQAIINKGFELLDENMSYNEIKSELELLEKYVIDELRKKCKKLKATDIVNVATIASNNDSNIGELIQEAFNKSKIVKVLESDKDYDDLEVIRGMRIEAPIFDKAFITNGAKQIAEYKNIPLLIIDGQLDDLKPYAHAIESNSQGIAIIADHFTEQVVSLLKDNFNKNKLNIVLIKSPGFAQHRKDLISDIKLYTSNEVKNYNNGITVHMLSNITVGIEHTVLTVKNTPKKVEELISDLKLNLKEAKSNQKGLIQQRIDNLQSVTSIIKVGGKSEIEMKERKDRIDDAVLAVSCALEEGIIEGAGKALYLISPIMPAMFKECLTEPHSKIVDNGAKVDLSDDLFEKGIIDPVKVTRVAIQNAISVSKVILSTKAVVVNNNRWN